VVVVVCGIGGTADISGISDIGVIGDIGMGCGWVLRCCQAA
jgi:hypothetical protein